MLYNSVSSLNKDLSRLSCIGIVKDIICASPLGKEIIKQGKGTEHDVQESVL